MRKYLTYDDFLGKYHPIKNHLDKNVDIVTGKQIGRAHV